MQRDGLAYAIKAQLRRAIGADFIVFSSFQDFKVDMVIKNGKLLQNMARSPKTLLRYHGRSGILSTLNGSPPLIL